MYAEKSHLQIKAKNGAVLWCLSFVPAFEPQWFDGQNFGLHLFLPASLFRLCNSKLFSGVFHFPPVTFGFVRVCFVLALGLVFACFVREFKWNSTWMVESLRSWRCSRLSPKQYELIASGTDSLFKADIKQLAWILEQIFSPNGSSTHPVCYSTSALAVSTSSPNVPSQPALQVYRKKCRCVVQRSKFVVKINFSILLIQNIWTYSKALLFMKWITELLDFKIFGCICIKNAYYHPP